MGVCDAGAAGCAAVHSVGEGSRAAMLANTAWAFATLGQPDARLFTALAKEAERRAGNFNPQNLANRAWAFATLGQPDAQLGTALAREALRNHLQRVDQCL